MNSFVPMCEAIGSWHVSVLQLQSNALAIQKKVELPELGNLLV